MSVQKVTDEDFKSIVEKEDKVVVKFFAGWCGSCRLFAPKFKRMAGEEAFKEVVFLDVNAEENEAARKWAGVDSLPFFVTVKNGEIVKAETTAKEESVRKMIEEIA